jgi:DNA topoisomerase-1
MAEKNRKGKTLVIVESPAKAKTLKKILGSNYEIKASMGHIRDLPKSRIGVNIEDDFKPDYIPVRGKAAVIKELKKKAEGAGRVLLASDPDREGEAIAWHLAHLLSIDPTTPCRIRMYEITSKAVKESVKKPARIDQDKVDAQQARRILDRLVGYKLSPLLWKKVRSRLTAGRVQSVALRLIAEREREIQQFESQEYWLLDISASGDGDRKYTLRLEKRDGKNLVIGSLSEAEQIEKELVSHPLVIEDFKIRESRRPPLAPFKTSTLQQEASRRLGFSPQRTMRIAQDLYEGIDIPGKGPVGLITYMRTDSLRLSDEALASGRDFILERYGRDYLPETPNSYVPKGRSQDAHEAIRPTDVRLEPGIVKDFLKPEQARLYELIWKRFVSCQMSPAIVARTTVEVGCGPFLLKQSGVTVLFEGWGKAWPLDMREAPVPKSSKGERLLLEEVAKEQRFTQPPTRYSESGLVKALEENGIGRPSTYASIVQTLEDRGYAALNEDRRLEPSELGLVVNDFLVSHFSDVIEVNFTARMEGELDQVENGTFPWIQVPREFWASFKPRLEEVEHTVEAMNFPKEEPEPIGEDCPDCGAPLVRRKGRFGEFIACSAFPKCRYSRPILKSIGVTCPKCGKGQIVRRRSKKGGRTFFGCERYPECDFVSWDAPTGEHCEKCGAPMFVRGKGDPFCPACRPRETSGKKKAVTKR